MIRITFRNNIVFNSIIIFVFWLIFIPGFYSGDSFGVLDMVRRDDLNSSHTASYALYIKVISFGAKVPELVTLINALTFVFAITAFAWQLPFNEKIKFVASSILSLTPLVWVMANTFWHDIPFTTGFLLTLVGLSKAVKRETFLQWVIFGAILLSFRPNGIPTLLLFLALAFIFLKDRAIVKLIALATFITLFSGVMSSITIREPLLVERFAQEWMRNDISCATAINQTKTVTEALEKVGSSAEEWASLEACTFLTKAKINLTEDLFIKSFEYIPAIWFKLLKSDPVFIMSTHSHRNAYLLPVPFKGLPSAPFLHTNIEFDAKEISWRFPNVAEQVRKVGRAWNYFGEIFAYAGLWYLILLVVSRFRKGQIFKLSLLAFTALLLILFVVAPIPDARYALPVLIVGQLSLLALLFDKFSVTKIGKRLFG
jgi:hypothetical protein